VEVNHLGIFILAETTSDCRRFVRSACRLLSRIPLGTFPELSQPSHEPTTRSTRCWLGSWITIFTFRTWSGPPREVIRGRSNSRDTPRLHRKIICVLGRTILRRGRSFAKLSGSRCRCSYIGGLRDGRKLGVMQTRQRD